MVKRKRILSTLFNFLFKWIDILFEFGINFWNTKLANYFKLFSLWGIIVILIGGLCDSNLAVNIGVGMIAPFAIILIIYGLFVCFTIAVVCIHELLKFSEKVVSGKNEIFTN